MEALACSSLLSQVIKLIAEPTATPWHVNGHCLGFWVGFRRTGTSSSASSPPGNGRHGWSSGGWIWIWMAVLRVPPTSATGCCDGAFLGKNRRRRRSDTLTQRQRTGAVGGGHQYSVLGPRKWKLRLSNCCVLARNSKLGAKSIAIKFGQRKQLSTYVKWPSGGGGRRLSARPLLLL